MSDSIRKVLMERDGLEEYEAEDRIDEAKSELVTILEEGGTLLDAEEVVKNHFGLEPDYLEDIMPFQ